ncbi:GNAT family N-acetyltransferase [Ensifer sesbaniae]|jgi:RimJ/RimL family protein N-acetyltransferase|uniref:GNAT family N-acetyltransferase n=1 Tax=Ensifer sesbaniae TaxID=1214071 RepID=UPI001567E144|nr:GNAT family protein [Ensifer sesbaniae]NRQ18141.1 Acetyltransferase [Ensifer sesbaniae]
MPTAPLLVDAFSEAHIPEMLDWFSSLEALVQWGGPGLSFPLQAAHIEAMLAGTKAAEPERLMFAGLVGGKLAGHAQVALDWQNGVGRLSRVAINPAMRGRGLARPFLREVTERFFANRSFERLELNVYTFNEAAIRTYRSLGFREEGVRRCSAKVGDARWDTAIYGLLRGEWLERALCSQ